MTPPYFGQWDPPVDAVIARNYFPDQPTGVCVEAGAGDGIADSSCRHFEQRGWRGINFEPCAELWASLVRNRPQAANLPYALSDTDGEGIFEAVASPDGLHLGGIVQAARSDHWDRLVARQGLVVEAQRTPLRRYDTLVTEPVDLCVLDVEGHELAAIAGMTHAPRPTVICVEYPLVELPALRAALAPLGYRFDFLSHNNAFFAQPFVAQPPRWGETEPWRW